MRTGTKRMLTASGEWAKHLRPFRKRVFWKAERQAQKKIEIDSKFK
ncbi:MULTISPECIES: hypothetical protein [Flavobacteriaceae]|uniref:Uncharacterized protein n=1 Tax=Flagellimonas oceani TaxID=2698672 RepID=A0A6G7J484_9FLAO|nr:MULTISPECIES: hypothetical protein [Flavobacteriaceae]MBW8243382.1 hypothetical protein [Allomuricauda oceani]MCR9225957.1 hypothetical protein [Flavobacteriaceae bacterium]QII45354.1 hypothetical protein GVT53_11900 [Allomuricauda oceani]